ncbi:uncharacterized protein LOC110674840 [Aedes aegypti]|uniref:Uncharacterized protein n=1 Tax=Aedes aegypti TaxID=7159 RepID=A0A6I8U102_AEDAE|nr:uncharacterized protein LOC110674840 [Aedes aegypti]
MSEQEDSKMLPQILKTVQESGQEVITTERLLERIRQNSSKPDWELQSQFNLALAEGHRTGLVSVQGGRVKPLFKMDQSREPRNFSGHLLLLTSDIQPPIAGSSRGATMVDAVENDGDSKHEEDEEDDDEEDDEQEEAVDCDCVEHAPRTRTRSQRSSGGSTHWLRPRNSDVTYDEMKLIRQVFNRKELGPEWNAKRRMTVPGTTQAARSARTRRSTARMPTRSNSRGRRSSAARIQTRSRSSRSRSRARL